MLRRAAALLIGGLLLCAGCARPAADNPAGAPGPRGTAQAEVNSNASPPAPLSADTIITRCADHVDILSPVYKIDRIYRSMTGPWTTTRLRLVDVPEPELLWITGCRVEMVDEQAAKRMPDQFMCHVNFDLDMERHKQLFGMKDYRDPRLFTLSQGQLDVHFPEGFGVPIRSDEELALNTQVLNLNWPDQTFLVRHHVTLDFVRDRDTKRLYRPLLECGVVGMISLEGREVAFDANELLLPHGKCPSCCVPGTKAVDWAEGLDRYARRFSNHWVVPPGRHEYRTRATSTLNLTSDTTIHFIAVHVHPFAESLELRDLTTGELVFKSTARPLAEGVGLEHVDFLSSPEGIAVTLGHEYELLTTYNNTSDQDQDSMAVMYTYVLDKEYNSPALSANEQQAEAATAAK